MTKMRSLLTLLVLILSVGIANAQWVAAGLNGEFYTPLFDNGGTLYAGTTNSGVFLSTNSGTTWTSANTGLAANQVFSFTVNGTNLFAGTWGGGVFLSSNGGVNWTQVSTGLTNNGLYVGSLAVNGGYIFAGTNGEGVYRSNNNGATWTLVNSGLSNTTVHTLAVSGSNLFAGTLGGVFLSTNNGASWTQVNSGLSYTDVRALAVTGSNLFAGTYGGGVYLSTNNGTSWSQVNTGLANVIVRSFAICGTNLYAGTHGGVFSTTNSGSTWNSQNIGLTTTIVTALAVSGTHLLAGTQSGGVFSTNNCSAVSSTGSICGFKFNDANGNGIQDPGEHGLANWIITLTYAQATGLVTKVDTTDATGRYCFENLQPGGTYTVSETQQALWQQTYPASPGTYSIPLASGQNKDSVNFGNYLKPVASKCDSLHATATKVTPGDCIWSLTLHQPATMTGISSVQIISLAPNQFTTGTGLGVNFGSWITSGNTYYAPSGTVPGGTLNNFFTMSLSYVTSPQVVAVNWLNNSGGVVCTDTLRLYCEIPCTTIKSDTVTCLGSKYNVAYTFTNNAAYNVSNIVYTVVSPGTVTITPLTATVTPQVTPGATSTLQTIQITGAVPGDIVKILARYNSPDGCCWCYDTLKVVMPHCGTVCDSLSVHAAGSPTDCCYDVTLMNNSSTTFSNIEFALLSGGMFSTVATTAAPGWGFTNVFPNNLINLVKFVVPAGVVPIGTGAFSNVLDMCIRQYTSPNQVVEVRWIKNGVVMCRDTLRFTCVPTDTAKNNCSQLIHDTLTCMPNGTIRFTFQVQNNSTINATGFGIHPTTPGVTFSDTLFTIVPIMPNQVSPVQTIFISGLGQGQTLCFYTAIFSIPPGANVFNYCCHSDTFCIATPACGGNLGSICGTKFNDLNGNGVRNAGEPGLPNWQITLGVPVLQTVVTDSLGNYCFTNIPAGTYIIKEINKIGWQQTFPIFPGTYSATLASGAHRDSVNFGNRRALVQPDTCSYLCNPDFDDKSFVGPSQQAFVPQDSVPCWKTTAIDPNALTPALAHVIEFWGSGFGSVPSHSGTQFVELNAKSVGTLYQDFYSNSGGTVTLSFWHHGRVGYLDSMNVSITNVSTGSVVTFGPYVANDTSWTGHSVQTILAPYTTYVLSFISLPVGGLSAGGNFLDDIKISCPSSICGVKFNDLNGNGVKDAGEPGLANWSIILGGTMNITAITDADGAYCFTDLIPGNYTASEANKPGWTQTAPSTGSYAFALATGQHIVNLNFGNKASSIGCVTPPDTMVAWWPLDETTGTTTTDLAGFNNSGVRTNGPVPVVGKVLGGLQFDGVDDYVEVPDHPELRIGTSNFSFDAWINTTDSVGVKDLVDKRTLTTGYLGYCFFLSDGKLSLSLANGTYTHYISPVFVANGKWNHIAVTISRKDPNGITFYLNGVPTLYGDPTTHQGSFDNTSPLRIGSESFDHNYQFKGILDEIELFSRVVRKNEIVSIFQADRFGKCKPGATPGSIGGAKFNDVNGNGVRDPGEPLLANWVISLTGAATMKDTTDNLGRYQFANLPAGTYTVSELNQTGWVQTAPSAPGAYTVQLTAGQAIDTLYFGNRRDSCTKTWQPLGTGATNGLNGWVWGLATIGTNLYVGGLFTTAGGIVVNRIAKWNGSNWSALAGSGGIGVDGPVTALLVRGTDLYVSGWFTHAGGIPALNIAKWDGTNWTALGAGLSATGAVQAMAIMGNTLYATSNILDPALGGPGNLIAKWDLTTLTWSPFAVMNDAVETFLVDGTNLYAGGQFTIIGGVAANNIAKWNGTVWSPLGSGTDYYIGGAGLKMMSGILYTGGRFTHAGGNAANYIAKWDGSAWSSFGTGINNGMDASVESFAVMGTDLIASGGFTTAQGVSAYSIAKWNGTTWSPLGSGMNNGVWRLAVIGDDLYAGGVFTIAGGVSANYIAKYSCGTATSVGENKTEHTLPLHFQLEQNYPNPFNPSTRIEYSLETAVQVSLTIYNLLGLEVAVLVNGRQEAGNYSVSFPSANGTLNLPSGVYFYRLEAGSFVSTKKLLLMK